MNCDRCGKELKILFSVGGFLVCTDCCDKVRMELEIKLPKNPPIKTIDMMLSKKKH